VAIKERRRRAAGRPEFEPTDEQRKVVRAMAGYGVPQADIGKVIGCHAETLRKHFREELDKAEIEANSQVAQTAYQMATSGRVPAATFFWLKCRAGWKETFVHEHGGHIGITDAPTEDLERELATLRAKQAAAAGTRDLAETLPVKPPGILH
jgi:hypothetical protein